MKTITFEEAKQMIYEVASQATIYIQKSNKHVKEEKTILSNATVWDVDGNQIGISNNEWIADHVMQIIINNGSEFRIYSNYFNWATGKYKIA